MKYSFIIPIYNGEIYLKKCFDSVLAQTFTDYEIIAVNDGSVDKSEEICREYAEKYPFFKLISTENHGVCAARNTGLDKAQGENILFVDCDDEISPYMLEYAEKAEDYDAVFVKSTTESAESLEKIFDAGTSVSDMSCSNVPKRIIYDDKKGKFGVNYNTVWGIVYKKKLIDNTRFENSIKIGEDKLFNFEVLLRASSVGFIGKTLYYCREHKNSVMNKYSENYLYDAEKSFFIFERLIDGLKQQDEYEKMLALRSVKILNNILRLNLCNAENKKTYREKREVWRYIINKSIIGKYFSICDCGALTKKDKIYYHIYRRAFFEIDLINRIRRKR